MTQPAIITKQQGAAMLRERAQGISGTWDDRAREFSRLIQRPVSRGQLQNMANGNSVLTQQIAKVLGLKRCLRRVPGQQKPVVSHYLPRDVEVDCG
jgi:hypothetical protein